MKKWIISLLTIVFILLVGATGHAQPTELMEAFSLHITVHENNIEYEWEYDSPSDYQYTEGNQVIKGEEAKQKVEKMVEHLDFSEGSEVEQMVKVLKERYFPNLERLDIRYMNGDSKLYTWVWEE
ncbi:hypothetical protein [Halalkalibacter urbisdiaboli]|uniref:hypothetical protein n=1 Tax=Halalkalibacter urbisdiaboli TaxID=1960589 RepID=UPI000B43AC98|nr:hypothetical protein [Halalkalibacter urbisdiaboli]